MFWNILILLANTVLIGSLALGAPVLAEESGSAIDEKAQADGAVRGEESLLRFINTPWTGDLDGMLRRELIRVLVVHSKSHYFIDKGKTKGIAYELLTHFEGWLNKKYPPRKKHIKTVVAFVPVSRDKLIPALLEGRGDIAVAALTITPERRQLVDFSEPFFRDINEILVTGPASPKIETLNDLAGKEIFVRKSASYWEHLERLNEQFHGQSLEPVVLDPAPEELQDEDLMEMLNAGLSGMLIVDDYKAVLWSKVFPNLRLHHDVTVNSGSELGWMIRKETPDLKEAINEFAKTHKQGTLIGNILVRRYVDKSNFVKNAVSAEEIEKFRRVVDLFRRYGERYDLDHLLMMAQAYQESALNQKTKSPVGAVGIMQLMPATGKQMGVGDIRKLEPNIHAGVKYIRHIIDQYFKDESMDELNKMLFAFAAYNAGPGRVRGLRRAAEKAGLDPNVWVNNVELMAAKKIGSETVTYVSNIFKYYVAYKLLQEEEAAKRTARESLQMAK
jgi:membrane-bound lytic murein transglycosylase MltF